MDLAEYRARSEAFTIQLGRERHRHFAGLKPTLELDPIYAGFADLFDAAAVEQLRGLADSAPADDRRRAARALLAFCVECRLGAATRSLDTEVARREATGVLELDDGRVLGYRESLLRQANTADAGERARIEAARLRVVTEQLQPLREAAVAGDHATARELGWPSYRAMCETLTGIDYGRLARQATAFLAATQEQFARLLDAGLRASAGVTLADARRSDLPRFFRNVDADRLYPRERLLEVLRATLAGLGIELDRQRAIHVDVEARPRKSPRPFCAPVRVPQEIHLVVAPTGGRDDYVALLHECGHAEHYAWTDPALPFEFRRLGDNSVTEAFAFLFDGLADDATWLAARLGANGANGELAGHARASRLLYIRRYCAKLVFELELHGGGDAGSAALADAYAERLTSATGLEWPPHTWLTDLDPLLYCASYLRAWALEARLRATLHERFGPAWFEQRAAGEWLKSLWREGQRLDADELAARACDGEALDFAPLLDEFAAGRPALSG
jgi:hypothetical protein